MLKITKSSLLPSRNSYSKHKLLMKAAFKPMFALDKKTQRLYVCV